MSEFRDSRDGKVYKTVKIGSQVWLAENLNYAAGGSICYGNDPAKGEIYGRLYDWRTAQTACPAGWHLPSDEEWKRLVNFVGGEEIAGKRLKTASGWYENGNGTDDYGFSALPGGFKYADGNFLNAGSWGGWWSTTEAGASKAWRWLIVDNYDGVRRHDYGTSTLFSVRCVAD